MMPVIVDDGHAIPCARAGEAPSHPAEFCKRFADPIVGNAKLVRDRNRRGGIKRIVPPRHGQPQAVDLMHRRTGPISEYDGEARFSRRMIKTGETHVGLRILAIGDDAPVGDLPDQKLHHGMIRAHDGKAVKRHVFDKRVKGFLHRLEGLEMIEVLRIDIGDDGNVGRQL